MILVIDNYDSFTYNLVQLIGSMGFDLRVLRNDDPRILDPGEETPERIIISPGPGRPEDAGHTLELIKKKFETVPILGVCLGHQCIAEAFGGKVIGAPRIVHGKAARVYHYGTGIYRNVPNPLTAARYHSLIVDEGTLPECLEVSSYTSEGEIMGIRHVRYPVEGVQFHPESILTTDGPQLVRNFLEGVR